MFENLFKKSPERSGSEEQSESKEQEKISNDRGEVLTEKEDSEITRKRLETDDWREQK